MYHVTHAKHCTQVGVPGVQIVAIISEHYFNSSFKPKAAIMQHDFYQ